MMQVPTVQPQAIAPSYNAVKIDVNNPQVAAPGVPQQNYSAPIYSSVPQQSIYELPNQSIYTPNKPAEPKAKPEQPTVPAPVIVPTTTAPAEAQAKAPVPPEPTTPAPEQAPAAAPKQVEVKAPQNGPSSGVDVKGFVDQLNGKDLDAQEKTLESMANLVQAEPEKAKDLLTTEVMDSLTNIVQADTSKLDAKSADANKLSPQKQAEANKKYAVYTTALLEKLYGDSVEKMNNTVVPMTELPGAAVVVEQIKSNPNPAVRAAGIDALSYIQRPEYKKDLTTIFTLAKQDKAPEVQKAASDGLDKLAKLPDATPAPADAQASSQAPQAQTSAQPAAPSKDAKPQDKPEAKKAA